MYIAKLFRVSVAHLIFLIGPNT